MPVRSLGHPKSSSSRRRSRQSRFSALVRVALVALALPFVVGRAPLAQSDVTPPTISARSPQAGATGVSTLSNLQAVFSESIQPATLSMVLRNSTNQVVASQVAYDNATRTATLDPNAELLPNQQFTVTVSGARDLAGNQMTQVAWSFTTASAQFVDEVLPQTGLFQPTVVQFAADGRVFVAVKSGRIYVYDSLTDTTPTLVADLRVSVYNFWDRGMLGMALHPNFPATPYIYVLYTYDAVPGGTAPRWGSATNPTDSDPCGDPTGNGCVATGRLTRLDAGNAAQWPLDPSDEQPLVTDWFQQFPSHSVGSLVFGPDGALYASGGDGASFNYVDYGQTSSNPSVNAGVVNDPPGEGGALRAQDIRTVSDPVTLDGSIVRIDPDTGAALPDNPRAGDTDANGRRIIAHGLRNPFRLTVRPGTSEIWSGDVGWGTWEEINRIVDPVDSSVENFGWPCYEGSTRQSAYDTENISICENLYAAGAAEVSAPYFSYRHSEALSGCGAGSSSISGLAFYPETGGGYPEQYNGALFFSDYSRSCVWAMHRGADGLPDPGNIVRVSNNGAGPVSLLTGPNDDVYYPGFNDHRIHRIRYAGSLPPVARIQATPTLGAAPLQVNFSAATSSDPEGQALTYAWDLDGDGAFDDSTAVSPEFVYGTGGVFPARLLVTDTTGLSNVAVVNILVNANAPVAIIDTPAAGVTWKVGDTISFTGHGVDSDEPGGTLPPSALFWEVVIQHCPSNCHTHSMQTFTGVAGGSFTAPDHEFPSYLELRLTVTDSTGLQHTTSRALQPQTVDLTFATVPSGLQLAVNASSGTTPFVRTVISGSSNSVSAPSSQAAGGNSYQFTSWSDGLAASHNLIAPPAPTTFTATYTQVANPAGLVAAYGFNEGAGTTAGDLSGNNHTGILSGATWSTQGRFGGALQFDGIDDLVTVADTAALDLTTGMTLEAWVNPTALGGWRTVVLKETSNDLAYTLYADDGTDPVPAGYGATSTGALLRASGTGPLPLNTWSHLAVTYGGGFVRFYVNGVLVNSVAATGSIRTSANALRIGGNSVWGEYFAGRIDEVRIYNRALALSEIQSDLNSPVGGTPGPDTVPPTTAVTAPAAGSIVRGTVALTATATDNIGVSNVQFLVDGAPLGAPDASPPYSASWDTTLATPGAHTITSRAVDAAENTGISAGVTVTVDNTAPTVTITNPTNGATVSATIDVSANAADVNGIASVQFRLDGANLGAADTVPPFSVSWATTGSSNGSHTLSAIATDAAGNQSTAANVSVTVANTWPVPSGLVAAYTFHQGSGTSVADASGLGRTGTISGATWSAAGRFGKALSFDGVNDMVTVADAASLDLTTGMTLEAWVNPTALSGWRTVVLKETANDLAYTLYAHDGTDPVPAGYGATSAGTLLRARGTSALPLNTWSHIAVTYGGGFVRFYLNGALITSTAATGSFRTSNNPLRIGGNNVWGEYFSGLLDEIRIYNRALTQAEIQAGMNQTLNGS